MASSACKGVCTIVSEAGSTSVLGHLVLTQNDASSPTNIAGSLSGLTPGKHGISVCISGDLSQGAESCGPIFNPFGAFWNSRNTGRKEGRTGMLRAI